MLLIWIFRFFLEPDDRRWPYCLTPSVRPSDESLPCPSPSMVVEHHGRIARAESGRSRGRKGKKMGRKKKKKKRGERRREERERRRKGERRSDLRNEIVLLKLTYLHV